MAKKLTKAERALDEKMLAILENAARRPGRWHDIGKDKVWAKAAQLLADRGAIEIWKETGLYRLKAEGS